MLYEEILIQVTSQYIFPLILLTFIKSLKVILIKMIKMLMLSAKFSTASLLNIKVFLNKGYGFIIFVHDVTVKILSYDTNCKVDVAM